MRSFAFYGCRSNVPVCVGRATGTDWVEVLHLPRCLGVSRVNKVILEIVLGDRQMRKHKGFTLIELVVVVMILGILAAVAAPKLLNTSGAASDNAAKESLGVVRDAIERYAAEHGGAVPPAPLDGATGSLTPYLRVFPKCPVVNQNATVKTTSTPGTMTPGGTEGWQYNTADGGFIINSASPSKVDGAHYDTW